MSCSACTQTQQFDAAAFEAEKAAITSYEENWDSWDGPVWDWRSTNKPAAKCTCAASNKSLEALKRPTLLRNNSSCSSIKTISSETSEASEWHASSTPACIKCGHGNAIIHV